jgi:hypothetical protein
MKPTPMWRSRLKLRLLLNNQSNLVTLIEMAERGRIRALPVCQHGFHADAEVHREVVAYLASVGCETPLVPDDCGMIGVSE